MKTIRFIHTADIHFGVENYGRIDPETGIHTRLLDFERAFSACVDRAIAESIDFFIFCGDAYKTAHPSPTQQRLLMRALLRLHAAQIPVVIIVGNHDHPASFGKAHALDIYQQLPLDGFIVVAKPALFLLTTKSGPVQIIGIPWPMRSTLALHESMLSTDIPQKISEALSACIQQYAQEIDPQIPTILGAHLTVSTGIFSGSEKRAIYGNDPILHVHELAYPAFDYVALGHLHRHQNLNPQGAPPVVYSGSIERVDFGERKEEKGFCLVTIEQTELGRNTHYEFIQVPTRPFIQINVTIRELPGIPQTTQILQEISRFDIAGAIVKIIYSLPRDMIDRVEIDAIQRACGSAMMVAAITAERTHSLTQERRKLTTQGTDTSLRTLVTSFCAQKPELRDAASEIASLIERLAAEESDQEPQRDPHRT
jgi:exonuclease SbcD